RLLPKGEVFSVSGQSWPNFIIRFVPPRIFAVKSTRECSRASYHDLAQCLRLSTSWPSRSDEPGARGTSQAGDHVHRSSRATGLSLDSAQAPVEMIVVHRIEKPSANSPVRNVER